MGLPGGSVVKNLPATAEDTGDVVNPWIGKSPGEGNGNPLQYSCLGNPMDRGARQATVHGVIKSLTQRRDGANMHIVFTMSGIVLSSTKGIIHLNTKAILLFTILLWQYYKWKYYPFYR